MDHNSTGLRRAAYHEAGHAVMAYAVGRPFMYVTIVPGDESRGRVRLGRMSQRISDELDVGSFGDPQLRALAEGEILIHLGGMAALDFVGDTATGDEPQDDMGNVIDFALKLVGDQEEARAYVDWLWIRTKRLIRLPHHQAALHNLAAALLTEKRLSYTQARHIIRESLPEIGRAPSSTPQLSNPRPKAPPLSSD